MDKQERNITYGVLKIVFTFLGTLFGWLRNGNDSGNYDPNVLKQ